MRSWEPDFNAFQSPINKITARVRLPGFPIEYVNTPLIKSVGDWIGKFIRLDTATTNLARGKFARICVEVDLTKPLKAKYLIEGRYKQVEYEGLHLICYSCGKYGHRAESCNSNSGSNGVAEGEGGMAIDVDGHMDKGTAGVEEDSQEGFGPWMVVTRGGKKGRFAYGKREVRGGKEAIGSNTNFEQIPKEDKHETEENNEAANVQRVEGLDKAIILVDEEKTRTSSRQKRQGSNDRVRLVETQNAFNLVWDDIMSQDKEKEISVINQKEIFKRIQNTVHVRLNPTFDGTREDASLGQLMVEDTKISLTGTASDMHVQHFKQASDGRGRVQHLKPPDTKNRGHKESNANPRAIVSQRGVGRNLTGRLSQVQSQHGSSNKETRTGGVNSRRLMKKLQFNSAIFEEANGFSGGIWVLSNDKKARVQLLSQSNQFIHMTVKIDDGPSFLCTAVYGSPREDERHVMWDDVKQLSLNVNLPWILAGDFNDIKCMGEKKGGSQPDSNKCDRFADVEVRILPRHHSDHSPLLVKFSNRPNLWQDRPFRFIASWLDYPNFNDLMQDKWNKNVDFNQMLNRFVPILKKWNKEVYGNIGRRKNSLVNDIASVQLKRSVADSPNLHELEISLQNSLDHVLEEEELLWFQKSRHNWIMDGDKNTKFYHLRTVIRRSSNKISRLRSETNQWIENVNELKDPVCSFYKTLFTEDIEERRWLASANHWTSLSNALKDDLIKVPSMAEVTKLLNGMNAFKAPGLDGFPAIFFQK
ncbi:uncharacterized protein LOC133296307 [Gastrolobium bilobum]|uniref:uncharacterized protein LOC133296307 n=1 Tax=Gastrolobium bilobum TaxID=150636 RepID=UPI002AB243EF|nr:uncharacterized protein LOC133296307 [Gastrolobium bilobum]